VPPERAAALIGMLGAGRLGRVVLAADETPVSVLGKDAPPPPPRPAGRD
jgi:hypothetical protein